MSTATSTTPEHNPRKSAALRRSITVPANAAAASSHDAHPGAEIGATEGVETLFIHPNCRVIKFTSNAPSRPGSSTGTSSPGQGRQQQGTLPWATVTDKTMAAGPLEIYRVPGSVSFLHSGSLLHAILPRSNCWCVDGVSKFAMRVLPDTYYRIELPGESPEELDKVEEFKITLQKVLFYERTPCPFARTFTVDLPDEQDVQPKQKKRRRTDGPAKKWKLDKAYSWKPEGWTPDLERPSDESSGSQPVSDEEDTPGSSSSDDEDDMTDHLKDLKVRTPDRKPTVKERAQGINLRSVTAPPQLSLQSTPPSKLRSSFVATPASLQAQNQRDESSHRSLQSVPTNMPPSPPDSSTDFELTSSQRSSRTALPQANASPNEKSIILPSDPTTNSFNPPPSSCSSRASSNIVQGLSELSSQYPDQLRQETIETQPPSKADRAPPRSDPEEVVDEICSSDDSDERFVKTAGASGIAQLAPYELRQDEDHTNQNASLPSIRETSNQDPDRSTAQARSANSDVDSSPDDVIRHTANVIAEPTGPETEDPFAAIQARIQARRSIGGTEFALLTATRESSSLSSIASSGSLRSNLSRRLQGKQQQPDQALATTLVRKAYTTFLSPPAYLVLIMLKIAARFAKGAFPKALLFESPAGIPKRVPGSFDLDNSDIDDLAVDNSSSDEDEDDFGVPLRRPIRVASSDVVPRLVADPSVKERKGWALGP